MNRRKLWTTVVVVAVVAVSAWAAFPAVIGRTVRSKAAERGWTVEFRTLEWSWDEVTLKGVRASNAWMKADLETVSLDMDGTKLQGVRASGGRVEADLSKRPKGEAKSSLRTSAENLDVEITGLCGSGGAKARRAGKDVDGTVWADKVSAKCRGWAAEAEAVKRTGQSVTAGLMVVRRVDGPEAAGQEGERGGDGEGVPTHMKVSDLKLEADGKYVHALEATVDVRPDGVEAEADSVAAEVVTEMGPVTATRLRFGYTRETREFTVGAATMNAAMDAVSKDRLEALTIMVWGRLTRKDGTTTVDQVSVKMGKMSVFGSLQFTNAKNFEATVGFDKTECQTIIDTAPKGFLDRMAGFKFSGTVASKLAIVGKAGKFDVKFDLDNRCKAEKAPPEMDVANFRKKFRRTVPGVKDDMEVESGPGSDDWTPLNRVSPFMAKAVMTTEDTGFLQHRGFIPKSVENSLKENLEAGRFARGGSTVSMQLSKNLWLSRTKTISRKAQEFFLTAYLEQSMSKQEIMELYLNVVEFGPGIYGIRQAALQYFGKSPEELTVAECAFLASVLPSPRKDRFSKEGKLSGGWDDWVRRIVKLMRTRDLITDQEEADGVAQTVSRAANVPVGTTTITVAPGGVDPKSWR